MIKHGFLLMLAGAIGLAVIVSAEAAGTSNRQPAGCLPRGGATRLSVPFVQNQGQVDDDQVLFYARTFGGTVYVTADGQIVYALPHSALRDPHSAILQIREVLVDADLVTRPSGAECSGAVINSFIGSDPCRWQANIPAFSGVRFGEVYAGITLEVRATGDNVEKIFTVAPGADPARIALRLAGAEGVSIAPSGELEARTVLGPVRFTAPVAYQHGAAGEIQNVDVAYALEGDQVGFCVGAFDAARPLVIDPLLASTFIGGTSSNIISAMALDSQTNVLVAGYTASTDFPVTTNGYAITYGGGNFDGFVAKFDPLLTNLLSATYLGGMSNDVITAMVISTNNDDVYLAGYTDSSNFPVVNGYTNKNRGVNDGFVARLSGGLTNLVASTYLGGKSNDQVFGMTIDPGGFIYLAGGTESTNFPFTAGCYSNKNSGRSDAFVAKLPGTLASVTASTYLGGKSNDQAFGVAVDTNGFVYLAGGTYSTNFPACLGYTNRNRGLSDAFVAKLSGALTSVVASTYLGGKSNDVACGLAVVPFTNIVCVVGYTYSTNFPQNPTNDMLAPGYTNCFRGGADAFLTRLDPALSNLLASTYLGGTSNDEATAVFVSITTNAPLRIYVAGWTSSTNFPVTPSAYDTTANGGRDVFVTYFGTGSMLQASTYLGGQSDDSAYAVALAADRYSLFVAGATASTNFPTMLRSYNNDRVGQTNADGFVTRLGAGLAYGTVKWQATLQQDPEGFARFCSPVLGWDGTIYVGGGSNLYAYDANGHERWRFQARGRITEYSGAYAGLGSTPAIGRDGTLYFGTQDGYLHAVRDDGAYATGVWTNYFPGGDPYIFASPAIADDGTIYLGTYAGKVYAVDADGAVQWTNSINYSMVGSPAIATNGRIFVADSTTGGKLYMLNQDNGATLRTWSGAGQFVGSPMIGSNGWVYIGSSNNLYAFDPASTETQCVWQAAGPIYSSPALGSNGVIYVGGGSNLYAFNAAGGTDSVWNTGAAIKSSPAIAEDGTIYVGSADKNLYAFNRDGSTNWVFPAGGAVNFHSPVLRRDGTVYFADNTNVYAIFGHAQTDQSAWPAYKHDVLRTGNAAFDAAPILQPTNLVARGASSNSSILVSWAGNPNADYYELYRNHLTTNLADAVLVKTLLTTNYLDTNAITAGLICTYWVRVATPVAMSDFSEFARGGIPPLAPTFVTATKANHTNEIIVTWTNSANATNYFIYSNTVPEALSAGLAWITNAMTPEYVDTNITRGLTCYYWVQASNEITGSSGFSDYDYGGTPPCPPTNITTTTNEYRWVDVAWNTNTSLGASMYVVYRNTSNSLAGSSNLAFASDAHYNDTNNQPFVDYYYWIQATNQYGVGEISTNSPAGFRQLAPPLAVTATKGVEPYNKIRVTWQLKAEAVSYVIYRNITNDADTASQISTPITNYIDDYAIERGAKYYYWARSKSGARTSVFSDGDGYVNMGGTPPFPPGNIRTNSASGASVSVTWDAANHATGYEVFRAVSYDPPATPLAAISLPPYADTLALPGQRYYYWVRATNQFGASDLNGVATGYRPLAPPDAVMASAGLSADHLVVTWSVASNASSYELWRGTNSASAAASMLANSVTANTYDDTASVPGRQYYYWVKAKTAQFVSDFSPFDIGWRTLGQVDIGVSDLVFLPLRMAVGAVPSAISFRVTNHGVQNMAAPNTGVGYNVWISGNAVFGDADDQCLGGGDLSLPLTVGNSVIVVLTKAQRDALVLPPVGPGSYYIFVNIQHAAPAQWLDPNLANNTISRNGGCIQVPAGTNQLPVSVMVNDYNGDGYTDQAMYQEATGNWQVWFFGAQGLTKSGYGGVGCQAVPGDYDGDGKTDFAVYRESTGTWQGWFSSIDYATVAINGWGGPGFEPVPADYDGDGKIDPAVYQESTGTWKGWFSSAVYAMESVGGWGGPGFEPVPADYDGDGWADPAVYHEASGTWWAWLSDWAYSQVGRGGWGGPGYRPAVADYDRDGIMDPAVFLASTGSWRGWLSDSGYVEVNVNGWGITGAVAVPGDYDGDGKADPAVYCDSFGLWRLWLSGSGYHPADILAWPGDGFRPVWNN